MNKKDPKQIIKVAIGLLVTLTVMMAAFIFRGEIEKYAMTGYLGVFIACFAATSTILLPAPGILIVIQYAQLLNPVVVVFLGGLGTSLGEMIGYSLGRNGNEIADIKTDKKIFNLFRKRPYTTVFLFSLIPLPIFDVVGIGAGMIKLNPIKFWVSCFWGKTLKLAAYVFIVNLAKEFI